MVNFKSTQTQEAEKSVFLNRILFSSLAILYLVTDYVLGLENVYNLNNMAYILHQNKHGHILLLLLT